jgi:predicted glutamine amidotransferase
MCRMIAYVGEGSVDLGNVFDVFRAGSKSDPFVSAALGPNYTCHPHGWGFAIYDGSRLHHYRSSLPVWEDEFRVPAIKGKTVLAMFHSRLASDPSLDTPICSHPFVAATDKEVLVFAHNGGVEMDAGAPTFLVDSEWALRVIVEQGGIDSALPDLKKRTKRNSALNLIMLAIPRDKRGVAMLHCLNYYKTENADRMKYYRMYTADLRGGRMFLSSTFMNLGIQGAANVKEAEFGKLFRLGS